jgi:hypothetical protein
VTTKASGLDRGRGRHEKAVNVAIGVAVQRGILDDLHGVSIAQLRALGRQLDSAEIADSAPAVVQLSRELRELLDQLGMMPTSSDAADPFAQLLDELDDASSDADRRV